MLIVDNKYISLYNIMNESKLTNERQATKASLIADHNQILSILKNNKTFKKEILPYLYDQLNGKEPELIKYVIKDTAENTLQFSEKIIDRDAVVSLFRKEGYEIIEEAALSSFIMSNGTYFIKIRGTSKTGGTDSSINTVVSTAISEQAVLIAIQKHYTTPGTPLADELMDWIKIVYPRDAKNNRLLALFNSYVESGYKSADVFYKMCNINPNDYYCERRGKYSQKIYDLAKYLGAPSKDDNWNPADLMLIQKDFYNKKLDDYIEWFKAFSFLPTALSLYNNAIGTWMADGVVIPISLKKINSGKDAKMIVSSEANETINVPTEANITYINIGSSSVAKKIGRKIAAKFEIHTDTDYYIDAHAKNKGGRIAYEVKIPNSGHCEGAVDKANIINKLINNNEDVNALQAKLLDNTNKDNIKQVDKMATAICNSEYRILLNGDGIDANTLKQMYLYDGPNQKDVLDTYCMTIVNLWYVIKNINPDTLLLMLLSGMKVNDIQCPFYKIF